MLQLRAVRIDDDWDDYQRFRRHREHQPLDGPATLPDPDKAAAVAEYVALFAMPSLAC